ncbi:MAG: tRNA dihydrouridine(20/20a) synthase DusA [Casimicrobium sp.]
MTIDVQKVKSPWRFTTAPMMDWSDRHCRVLFRLLAPHARVYTEMVTTGPLTYGTEEVIRNHLQFSDIEHPVALQLGGSERDDLAKAAKLGANWGYDEINLNCGCPSERVQRGAFGACLMAEPALVADCVKAMVDAVPSNVPVTVKHRIGLDYNESYDFVRDFVGTVAQAGCNVFIVHARNAVLKGLSPKENREVPPLRYHVVSQLMRDFPSLTFVLNGGIATVEQSQQLVGAALPRSNDVSGMQVASPMTLANQPIAAEPLLQSNHASPFHGIMLGRAAYHDSYVLAKMETALYGTPLITREAVVEKMVAYAREQIATTQTHRHPTHVRNIARHMLGLYAGEVGGKAWRRQLSDPKLLAENDPTLFLRAMPFKSVGNEEFSDHRQPLLDAMTG